MSTVADKQIVIDDYHQGYDAACIDGFRGHERHGDRGHNVNWWRGYHDAWAVWRRFNEIAANIKINPYGGNGPRRRPK